MYIDNINYPAPKQEYKVLVRCATYNHSKYIEDALNGFAMQQTNFPFVCLVVDDASTDGEQEVIKAWMERECDMSRAETIDIPTSIVIIVPHKTNASCTFAFYLLKQNLHKNKTEKMRHVTPWREKCEYEAMCEGDDYWVDPLKLQKQVDFLEANPEYGMCYTKVTVYNESRKCFVRVFGGANMEFEELMDENTVPTLTVVLRSRLYKEYNLDINPEQYGWLLGDYPLWLWISKKYKIRFINEITGVYRLLEESASHSTDILKQERFINSCYDMLHVFAEKYSCRKWRCIEDRRYRALMSNALYCGNREKVRSCFRNIKDTTCKDYLKLIISSNSILQFMLRKLKNKHN